MTGESSIIIIIIIIIIMTNKRDGEEWNQRNKGAENVGERIVLARWRGGKEEDERS
jgi:hypothetical protein